MRLGSRHVDTRRLFVLLDLVTFLAGALASVSPCKDLVAGATTCPRGRPPLLQQCNQCLYLDGTACDPASRDCQFHLRFCAPYSLQTVFSSFRMEQCTCLVARALEMDATAQQMACRFELLLSRYDCDSQYSVKWSCEECKRAYQQWVCAMYIPFHIQGRLVRPCRSFCHVVEQKCPYFHPTVREQYAGERVFKCIDPNIPDLPSITPNSSYGPADQCYSSCHLYPDSPGCGSSAPDSTVLPSVKTSMNYSEPAEDHQQASGTTPAAPSSDQVNSTLLYSSAAQRTVRAPSRGAALCAVVATLALTVVQCSARTWPPRKGPT